MTNYHMMLDLETFSTSKNAAIASIGAVLFDPLNPEDRSTFYAKVKPDSNEQYGLEISASTFVWWLKQSEEARKAMSDETDETPLAIALMELSLFYRSKYSDEPIPVWGNGVAADNIWVENAYKKVGVEKPWSYREDRCFRTLRALFPDVQHHDFTATAHNALSDAIFQTDHLIKILKELKK